MKPIVEEEKPLVFVIRRRAWSIDYDTPEHAIPGLQCKMTVIPCMAILFCSELVRDGVLRRYWALGDGGDTIMLCCILLS